jgi:hypothetical protein
LKRLLFIALALTSLTSFGNDYIDCEIAAPINITSIDTITDSDKPGYIVSLDRIDASGEFRSFEFGIDFEQIGNNNKTKIFEAFKRAFDSNTPVVLDRFKVSKKNANDNASYCLSSGDKEPVWISSIQKIRNVQRSD